MHFTQVLAQRQVYDVIYRIFNGKMPHALNANLTKTSFIGMF